MSLRPDIPTPILPHLPGGPEVGGHSTGAQPRQGNRECFDVLCRGRFLKLCHRAVRGAARAGGGCRASPTHTCACSLPDPSTIQSRHRTPNDAHSTKVFDFRLRYPTLVSNPRVQPFQPQPGAWRHKRTDDGPLLPSRDIPTPGGCPLHRSRGTAPAGRRLLLPPRWACPASSNPHCPFDETNWGVHVGGGIAAVVRGGMVWLSPAFAFPSFTPCCCSHSPAGRPHCAFVGGQSAGKWTTF